MDASRPNTIHLKDYLPSDYLIETVDLDVSLEPTETRVQTILSVKPNAAAEAPGPLVLNGENIKLERVMLDGQELATTEYELGPGSLTLSTVPDRPFEVGLTTLVDPEANKALSGLYRSRGIYCTQCEPEGFRRITYTLDRPDVLSVYRTRVEADKDETPILLANGNPVSAGDIEGSNRHFAIWHDPHPKPSYLFAMVGGSLALVSDRFTTASGREVELRIYVEPGKEDRCEWAMDSLKRSMRWDEERFGLEYDLDIFIIVAVSDFNMGAMENKGLNIFNDKLILARPDTATDNEYAAIEAVIAHEYFHNWTGNRVTCRDWFQLCLKEGLTVFRDQEFSGDMREAAVERISAVRMLKTHQFPEDNGPLAHPVRPDSYMEINNFYTATVYEKGAEICRMLQTHLGREGFRQGLDLYFERHDGEAATVEDFVASMADATGVDLDQFMQWYAQAGTPEVACTLNYDPALKVAELSVSQVTPPTPGQPKKQALPIPLKLGLIGQNGEDVTLVCDDGTDLKDGVVLIEDDEKTIRFRDVPARPVPSLFREFSAPVRLTTSLKPDDLVFLMAHDKDLFNRWQAGQDYATRLMTDTIRSGSDSELQALAPDFARALGATLQDAGLEPAFKAETLKLPSESDIARELAGDIDTDAIHETRKTLCRIVATELSSLLTEIYESNTSKEAYSPDARDSGRRSLRNTALAIKSAHQDADTLALLEQQYLSASNMTDKMAALSILTHFQDPARDRLFDSFFEDWKDDHLVVDKWYMLQAISSRPDTLDRVKALTNHPLFSLKTPNKVRALIGAFAQMNPVRFNQKGGQGYEFVAETVLELDAFNPQVAARLMGAFKNWRKLEPGRRDDAKQMLEKVAGREGLSPDLYEIATKTLD